MYDYLPSNGQVSGISIYIAREENFNMNKKNGSDIQSMSFGMQLEIERSNDERQENKLRHHCAPCNKSLIFSKKQPSETLSLLSS